MTVPRSTGANGRPWVATRRELEQVLDQTLHPLGRGVGPLQVVEAPLGEGVGLGLGDPLGERAHLAQRLLQIVRGDRGELVELGVGAGELLGAALELGVGRASAVLVSASSTVDARPACALASAELGVGLADPVVVTQSAASQHQGDRGDDPEGDEDQPRQPLAQAGDAGEQRPVGRGEQDPPGRVGERHLVEVVAVDARRSVRCRTLQLGRGVEEVAGRPGRVGRGDDHARCRRARSCGRP